ncbi:MAG: DUF3316 domain-containing protein [Hoylesella buccalis]
MTAQTDSTPLDKITTNAKMIGWGYVDMLDTYLSPERYKGWQVNYLSHTTHEREDRRISTLSVHQGSFAHADNRAGNANEMQAMYHFAYAWHYNWHFLNRCLNVKAGGMLNTPRHVVQYPQLKQSHAGESGAKRGSISHGKLPFQHQKQTADGAL